MDVVKSQLAEYIAEAFGISEGDFDHETSLFSSGILDSFSMMEVVAHVEKTFSIKFGVLDMHLGNLDTISNMGRFIASRTSQP